MPLFIAPVGVLSILHKEADLAVARAARADGVPVILSTASSTTMEDVAASWKDRRVGFSFTGPATTSWRQAFWPAQNGRAIRRLS